MNVNKSRQVFLLIFQIKSSLLDKKVKFIQKLKKNWLFFIAPQYEISNKQKNYIQLWLYRLDVWQKYFSVCRHWTHSSTNGFTNFVAVTRQDCSHIKKTQHCHHQCSTLRTCLFLFPILLQSKQKTKNFISIEI